ncbi:c-type cytochrome [Dankookia sp. GCM10030260]|uniref:c-type cytochrome n=1 Tax=Dankookia sp. GCM10030260 TaxID=3273390 RepID=UPI00361FF49B
MRGPSLMQVAIAAVAAGGLALALHRPEPVAPGTAQAVAPSASAPAMAPAPALSPVPAAVAATPAAAQPATAQPATAEAWTVPDPDALPNDIYGRTVRRGRDLITRTSSLIGPDAADPAMRFAGNGLDCQSCHLQAGSQQFGLPLAGVWGVFPQHIGREDEVRTLEERVNGCMERSMNGRPLPVEGPETKAILISIRHTGAPERVGQSLHGRGSPPLPLPGRAAAPARGRQVFAETCAACHGAEGEGQRLEAAEAAETGRRYRFPPLCARTATTTAPGWRASSPPRASSTPTCRSAPPSRRRRSPPRTPST